MSLPKKHHGPLLLTSQSSKTSSYISSLQNHKDNHTSTLNNYMDVYHGFCVFVHLFRGKAAKTPNPFGSSLLKETPTQNPKEKHIYIYIYIYMLNCFVTLFSQRLANMPHCSVLWNWRDVQSWKLWTFWVQKPALCAPYFCTFLKNDTVDLVLFVDFPRAHTHTLVSTILSWFRSVLPWIKPCFKTSHHQPYRNINL